MTMEPLNCSSIKSGLEAYLREGTHIRNRRGLCVLSLPLRTADGRWVSVYIEPTVGDAILIHDGGKTLSELYAQGIHLSPPRQRLFTEIAGRMGAMLDLKAEAFQILCKASEVSDAIMRVAECAVLATAEIAAHYPVIEDEPLRPKVSRALEMWKPAAVREITHKMPVRGRLADHWFDFVAVPHAHQARSIAVQVLSPTYSPKLQAERYGFLVADLDDTSFAAWPRVAVVGKAEEWTDKSLDLVYSLSRQVIKIPTGEEESIPERIAATMSKMVA